MSVDPNSTEAQAQALTASRRILARIRQDIASDEDQPSGNLSEEDREILAEDSEELLREDLRVFNEWHEALGTDPEAVLTEMRSRTLEELEGGSPEG